jgi:hypothetical protein
LTHLSMVRTERPSRCATLAAGSSDATGCLEGRAERVSSSESLGDMATISATWLVTKLP